MISDDFEVAAGSVIGRDHLRPFGWRNNQDSFAVRIAPDALVAVVTDGCGSESKSEVGATIGAALVAEFLTEELQSLGEYVEPRTILARVRWRTVAHIRLLANAMGRDVRRVIYDHFLFTVNGVLATRWKTVLFSIGDGVQFLNGERISLGPFANNTPPYLAYTVLAEPGEEDPVNAFTITVELPTSRLSSILIGTDGVEHLLASESEYLPGRTELAGPISQFWQEHRYFGNPDMVRRRLALMQNEHLAVDWHEKAIVRSSGKLSDDTTLVVVRRRPKP